MLSYQHIFHAGNHADILKHIALTILLKSLNKKENPYTVFDSHSGSGRYNLNDERALKTNEAENGIFLLLKELSNKTELPEPLSDYLELVKNCLAEGFYPGSPEIEKRLMRSSDTLILSELHPQEIENLRANIKKPYANGSHFASGSHSANANRSANAPSVHVHFRDGFETLHALTPPEIKRGLVLIDPSYEETSDYINCAKIIAEVHERWSTSIIALWYPVLEHRKNDLKIMKDKITASVKTSKNLAEIIDVQLVLKDDRAAKKETAEKSFGDSKAHAHLLGSGMFVVNAPWKFAEEIDLAMTPASKILKARNFSCEISY